MQMMKTKQVSTVTEAASRHRCRSQSDVNITDGIDGRAVVGQVDDGGLRCLTV